MILPLQPRWRSLTSAVIGALSLSFWVPVAHAACTLNSSTKAMNFRSDPFNGDFDPGASTAAGWGSGSIYNVHVQGAFESGSTNPQTGTAGKRILAAASGRLAGFPDRALQMAYISDTTNCHVGYWRFVTPTGAALYSQSAKLDTTGSYIVDNAASCAPGVAMAASRVDQQKNPASPKSDLVVVTPKNLLMDGTVGNASLYIANDDDNVNTFTKVDITNILRSAQVAFHSGSPLLLQDINGDGRADLLVASSHGNTVELLVFYAEAPPKKLYTFSSYDVLVPNLGFSTPTADSLNAVTGVDECGSAQTSRGVSGIARADIDNDGIPDILATSLNDGGIRFFKGVSATEYIRQPDIATAGNTGSWGVLAADYTGHGNSDLMVLRSGYGCGWKPGEARLLVNDGTGKFTSSNPPLVSPRANMDWVAQLKNTALAAGSSNPFYNFNYGIVFGKHSYNGEYSIWNNYPAKNYYASSGVATSNALTAASNTVGSLVDVRLSQISINQPAQTAVQLYVSADDGAHYEQLSAAELSGSATHTFEHLGTRLRWQAKLTGQRQAVTAENQLFTPAAVNTPSINALALTYRTANPQRFSWSSLTSATLAGTDYVYAATFDTPQMSGHLEAQNLSQTTAGKAGEVETVQPGVTWDAATRVSGTAQNSRNLVTGQRKATFNRGTLASHVLRSIPWTTPQLTSASNSPLLYNQMALSKSAAATQLAQLRQGVSLTNQPILRDPGHSSPAFVGPPSEDPNYMGANYATFAKNQANRTPMVLLGANDGMLHGFAASSGSELWGYVPTNLLGALASQLGFDSAGQPAYVHQALVEGPVTTADVYSANTGWRTVAFFGQGQGSNGQGENFYSAVDVTTPSTPVPLWEMTEGPGYGDQSCDGDPCGSQVCQSSGMQSLNPTYQRELFMGEMSMYKDWKDPGDNKVYSLLEAEHMDAETQGTQPAGVDWQVITSTSGAGATARGNSYIQPSSGSVSCTGTTLRSMLTCPSASFPIFTDPRTPGGKFFPMFRIYNKVGATRLAYTVDSKLSLVGQPTFLNATPNSWQWAYGPAVQLDTGFHQITIYMQDAGLMLDAVAVKVAAANIDSKAPEWVTLENQSIAKNVTCQTQCLSDPANQEWPQCGYNQGQKCCGNAAGNYYCQPVGVSCGTPNSNMGKTFSRPAVGRIQTDGGDRWVAFFASGPSAAPGYANVGRSLYMVDALSGAPMATWNFPAPTGSNLPDIAPALPGSPALVDVDGDGYVDRVYVGDLAGRLWKVNTHAKARLDGSGGLGTPSQFARCLLFDAGDPSGSGTRKWAPINMKPAVAMLQTNAPNVFFGTGAADEAPASQAYSFYSVQDTDGPNDCMSSPRTVGSLSPTHDEWVVDEAAGKGGFWADPVVVDNTALYYSSYSGNPTSINPCVAATGSSRLYARAIHKFVDARGKVRTAGSTLLNSGNPYANVGGILRSSPTVRGRSAGQVVRPLPAVNTQATEVLMQSYTGDVLRVGTVGVTVTPTSRMKVIRYRTVR